ncbi:hypothetical protein [uncultured Brevibacillus sp.]|uniref:hypothetical protein n=1 Tax=uncultured Brevibacillus sp. TaxID=169970 RepID=UPI0025930B72|nr:hypothetical protein [uncultured Brevibacillus sp.]
MKHFCPVCNGLAALANDCPRCGQLLSDAGKLYDFYGAYSPYREIDDAKLDNGYLDRQNHQCLHTGWCPKCQKEHTIIVQEWTPAKLTQPFM